MSPPVEPVPAYAGEPLDDEEERKPRVGLAIGITAAIIAVLGIGAWALWSLMTPDTPITAPTTVPRVVVPSLLTFDRAQATKQLEDRNLKIEIKRVNGEDDGSKGEVTAQNPVAETEVDAGSTVLVTINVGPKTSKIPGDLVGKDKDDVEDTLKDAGFEDVKLVEAKNEDADAKQDEVTKVSPESGETAALEDEVTVTYATGRSAVPNLVGLPENRARADANEAGFDNIQIERRQSNEVAPGIVIEQDPPANEQRERSSEIRLVIAEPLPDPTPVESSTPPPVESESPGPSPSPSPTPN